MYVHPGFQKFSGGDTPGPPIRREGERQREGAPKPKVPPGPPEVTLRHWATFSITANLVMTTPMSPYIDDYRFKMAATKPELEIPFER